MLSKLKHGKAGGRRRAGGQAGSRRAGGASRRPLSRDARPLCAECGAAFTSKLEGMFKDMELSKDIMVHFKQASGGRALRRPGQRPAPPAASPRETHAKTVT